MTLTTDIFEKKMAYPAFCNDRDEVKKGKENLEKHVLIHCINLLKRDPPHNRSRYILFLQLYYTVEKLSKKETKNNWSVEILEFLMQKVPYWIA